MQGQSNNFRICVRCGKEFGGRGVKRDRKYCSWECFQEAVNPTEENFWATAKETGECWEWQGKILEEERPYGYTTYQKQQYRAHRLAWMFVYGFDSIPTGWYVCHDCDNPRCINPAHLWVGTAKDNTQDMFSKGRDGARIRAAKNPRNIRQCETCGSAFSPTRVQVRLGNGRFCSRQCVKQTSRGGIVDTTCLLCGITFQALRCRLVKGAARFCGIVCANRYKNTHTPPRRKIISSPHSPV